MSFPSNLTPHQAAAFWQLKLLNADDVEKLAMSWLEAGFEAPELAIIAGTQSPTLREIGEDFVAALSALTGRDQLSNNEAGRIALAFYLEEMISGRMNAFDASREILKLQHLEIKLFKKTEYAGSELGIEMLLGTYYSIDDIDCPSQETIEKELISEAKKVLVRITTTSDHEHS